VLIPDFVLVQNERVVAPGSTFVYQREIVFKKDVEAEIVLLNCCDEFSFDIGQGVVFLRKFGRFQRRGVSGIRLKIIKSDLDVAEVIEVGDEIQIEGLPKFRKDHAGRNCLGLQQPDEFAPNEIIYQRVAFDSRLHGVATDYRICQCSSKKPAVTTLPG
jgi:hypothetical protein